MDGAQPGTRNERILAVLAAGQSSTAALAAATGIPERTVRAGLIHLRKEGLIVAPERGRYRLTDPGRPVIDDRRASRRLRPVPADDPASMVPGRAPDQPAGDDGAPRPAWAGPVLVIAGLGTIAAAAWMIAHWPQAEPPPTPPAGPWAPCTSW